MCNVASTYELLIVCGARKELDNDEEEALEKRKKHRHPRGSWRSHEILNYFNEMGFARIRRRRRSLPRPFWLHFLFLSSARVRES